MKPLSKPRKVDPWSLPRAAVWTDIRDIRPCMSKSQCEGGGTEVIVAVAKWLSEPSLFTDGISRKQVVSVEQLPAHRIRIIVQSSSYVGD